MSRVRRFLFHLCLGSRVSCLGRSQNRSSKRAISQLLWTSIGLLFSYLLLLVVNARLPRFCSAPRSECAQVLGSPRSRAGSACSRFGVDGGVRQAWNVVRRVRGGE